MEWHSLKIEDGPDTEEAVSALVGFMRREFEKAGSPAAFSVYRDSDAEHPVFFFSPEACAACTELPYFDARPCPPPDPQTLSRII